MKQLYHIGKTRRLTITALCFLIFTGIPATAQIRTFEPIVGSGIIDLRGWDPRVHGTVTLDAPWNFVWQELLTPETLTLSNIARLMPQTRSISPVTKWTESMAAREGLPAFGYGTYYLRIFLPKDYPQLSLHSGPVGSSVRFFWGTHLVGEQGRPAESPESYRGMWNGMVMPLPEMAESIDEVYLIAQVANWDNISPGFQTAPELGTAGQITAERERNIAAIYTIAGLFLIMGIYHLFLYFFRREDSSPLWFGIICFLLCLRVLVTDDAVITAIAPVSDLKVIFAGSYLTFTLLVFFFGLFITSLFRFPTTTALNWVNGVISLSFSILILISEPSFFTQLLRPYQFFAVAIGLAMTFVLVMAMARKRQSAFLFFMGFIVVLGTSLFDILKTFFLWDSPSIAPIGIVVFVVFQSMVLTRNSTAAIGTAERLSRHLQKINASMSRFVPKEFLVLLKRDNITEVQLGDHTERSMAVMFADIRSFSQLSERLSPEATFHLINRFLAIVGPIIGEHGGLVDKYLGDGVMALFPRSPRDAIAAGIAMCKAMPEVNEDRIRLGQELIDIGVGIHYGPLMLGTIGEPERIDGTVIADAVNLATRLQGLTRALGGHILVTEATLKHIPAVNDFQYRELGNFKVYNRSETVAVVEFFDCDPEEVWNQKRRTKRDFERAIYYFKSAQYREASNAFRSLTSVFPEDKACDYYLSRIRSIVAPEGQASIDT